MPGVKFTNSIERGLKVFETFTPATPRLRLQQIADKTGLPKVTVFRFVRTLMKLGYISHDPESKTYSLTPRVLSLGFTALSSIELRDVARLYLEELSRITDQNVNLGIMDKSEVVYIECIKRRQIISIDLYVGSRVNMYRTSIGRAILAFLSPDIYQTTLTDMLKYTEAVKYIGPKGERLVDILEEVRQKGYALTDGDFVPGVRTVAVPIFNAKADVEGAINMPVFGHMVTREELIERHLPLLFQAAEKISAARGYMKPQTGNQFKDHAITVTRKEEKMKV